jgi:tRNA dimethylallyltransferase
MNASDAGRPRPTAPRILIRGTNWLGDAVMTTPAVLRLREKFPNAHIALLTPEKLRELWAGHPAVNETISFAPGESVFSVGRKLRRVGSSRRDDRTAQRTVPTSFFAFTRQPDDLQVRVNARVDEMFARGLVEETCELLKRGLEQNKTAMQAIGYRQVVEHLRGERSLAETIELVKIRTRQFAKRQLTWFRAQKNLEWIELKPGERLEDYVQKIAQAVLYAA